MKNKKAKVSLTAGVLLCLCLAATMIHNTYADAGEEAAVASVIQSLATKYQQLIDTYNTAHPDSTIQLYPPSGSNCVALPTNSGIMQTYSLGSVDINKVCDGSFITLKDSRDDTIYHVAKLADGNVWMLDNLAIDLVAKKDILSSSNTNASDITLGYLKGTTTRNPETDPNGKYATAGVSEDGDNDEFTVPLVNIDSKEIIPDGAQSNSHGNNKVGGYYNYCAATAGSFCYRHRVDETSPIENATEDICPAGWRMPTGNGTGEYQALATAITDAMGDEEHSYEGTQAIAIATALSVPLSGNFSWFSGPMSQGKSGTFVSSSTYNVFRTSALVVVNFSELVVYPQENDDGRDYGSSVRCILKSTTSDDVALPFYTYTPDYKAESVNAYTPLSAASRINVTSTKNNQPVDVLETAPIAETLTGLGFTAYGPALAGGSQQYLNATSGVICKVSKSGSSCGHTNWQNISGDWKNYLNSIGKAYHDKNKEYPVVIADTSSSVLPEIKNSEYKPYQYTIVPMDNGNGLFYRANSDAEWVYYKNASETPDCSIFTGEAIKGFAGLTCSLPDGSTAKVSDLLAPDTGFFTGQIDGTKAIIYAGAVILGTGVVYIIFYSAKRGAHRNRFRK